MVDYRIDVVVDPRGAATGTHTVERHLTRVENRANAMRASIGRLFAMFGGAAIVGTAIRTLASFEQSIATVGAVSGASAREMEQLRATAERLGATTRFTATEAGEGLLFLARAGFSVSEQLGTVDGMLKLAQVGALDLGAAADIATNVLAGFGMSVDQTSRFVDVLAKTANSSNTNIQQLGDAFKMVAPVAKGVGVSLEETAAAIGTLSNAGLQATLAGTGLRRVISELESPSEKTRKILLRLGLSTEDVRISSVGLTTAMTKLHDAGMTASQGLEIFGQRGGPAALVLSGATEETRKLSDSLNKAAGYADVAAKRMDDNLMGSLLRVKSAFQAVILSVGRGGATGSLRSVLEKLAGVLRYVADNADKLIVFGKTLSIILGAKYLLGAVNALTVALLRNPFGLIAVGIAFVASLVPDFAKSIGSLIGKIGELGEKAAKGIDFREGLLAIASFADDAIATFKGLLAGAGAIFDEIGNSPQHVKQLLVKGFRDMAEASIKFFLAAFNTLGLVIQGIAEDIKSIIADSAAAMGASLAGNLEAAKTLSANATDYAKRALSRITSFGDQMRGELKQMEGIEILPDVVVSREAHEIGLRVAAEFRRAFEESGTPVSDLIEKTFGSQEELNRQAAKAGEEAQKAFLTARQSVPVPDGEPMADPFAGFGKDNIDKVNKLLFERVSILNNIQAQKAILIAMLEKEMIGEEELLQANRLLNLEALEASTALGDGFERAFLKMKMGAEDMASAAEELVDLFANRAVDAIHEFVNTGKFSFKEFTSALLSDISRIIIRLLVMRALGALAGGGGAAPAGPQPSVPFNFDSFGGGKAGGGSVRSGRSYLVGEEGPELFTPNKSGAITPNGEIQKAEKSEVNVQVVNVDDPNMVPQAINGGRADDAIINLLVRNRDRVNQVIR